MSFGTASAENAVTKAYHSLTLIAGLEASKENKARPVDLNVRGGGIFNKNLIVCGNLDVEGVISGNITGNIATDTIIASNITEGITIIGNLIIDDEFEVCANVIKINSIAGNNNDGDDITIQADNSIILNTNNVSVTGILDADLLCADTIQTNLLDPKNNGNIEINGDIIPTQSNAFCLGTPFQQWQKIYTGDIFATGNIFGNIVNVAVGGNLIMADFFCANVEVQTNKIVPKSGDEVCVTGNLDVLGHLTFLTTPSLIVNEVAIVSQFHLNQITPTSSVSASIIQAQPWITFGIADPGQQWVITEDGFYILQIVNQSILEAAYGFGGPRTYGIGAFPDTAGFQGSFIRSGSDYIIGGQAAYTAAGGASSIVLTITKVLN